MSGRALILLRALVVLVGVALANAGFAAQAAPCDDDHGPVVASAAHEHGGATHDETGGRHQTKPCCAACSAFHQTAQHGEAAPDIAGARMIFADVAVPTQARPEATAPPPRAA